MIISGGSRCNWKFFGKHLTNAKDNERVQLIELRGLAGDNVWDAFRQMDALAAGTRAKNFFYHGDINPREDEHLTPQQWELAVDTLEQNLGLEGHSRFVIEHEKNGRTHRHIIWSRIDPDTMTVVSDSRNYARHEQTARALEKEFGQEPVQNAVTRGTQEKRPERNPKNWETFRGHNSGIDPNDVKREVTELWRNSDSATAFVSGLEERDYLLCQGDRRDFVIVDKNGDAHSLSRRLAGVKAYEMKARMADIDREALPTYSQVKEAVEPAVATGEKEEKEEREKRHKQYHDLLAHRLAEIQRDALQPEFGITQKTAQEQTVADIQENAMHRALQRDAERQAALQREMLPYTQAIERGEELLPASTWIDRSREFMKRTAQAAGSVVQKVKDTWTQYLESRNKKAESREPEQTGWRQNLEPDEPRTRSR